MLKQTPQMSLTLALLIFVTSADAEDSGYCSVRYMRLCQEKGQHVGCQYPHPGPGESCENYTKIDFSEGLRNFVLHYINRHRQRVAAGHERVRGGLPIPKPDIMMYVEWDRELAYLAQRLADQCRFVHDDCRATVRYPYAGQTVGEVRWRRTQDSDQQTAQRAIRKVFDAWWGEKRRVQPQQLTSPFKVTAKGTIWGHFSQLAVWKLRAVGCAAVRHGLPHPRMLLVCDYSHTNMLGQKTISAGPLATCPPHTARRPRWQYPLLCSTIKYPLTQDAYLSDDDQESVPRDDEPTDIKVRDNKSTTRSTEVDIYVQRTSYQKGTADPETRINDNTREEDYYKDTDVYVQPRSTTKSVQEYYQKEESISYETTLEDTDINVLPYFREREYYNKKHYQLSQNYGDYSVIPLKRGQQEVAGDVNISWRPKMTRRTTERLDYEISDVMVPVKKKPGYRHPADTFIPLGVGVLRDIKRKYHDRNRKRRPTSRARTKDLHTYPRKPLGPSLKLDKDDIDQLFKDTGFKPNWTPKK